MGNAGGKGMLGAPRGFFSGLAGIRKKNNIKGEGRGTDDYIKP